MDMAAIHVAKVTFNKRNEISTWTKYALNNKLVSEFLQNTGMSAMFTIHIGMNNVQINILNFNLQKKATPKSEISHQIKSMGGQQFIH
jgi:hypothetical protein